MSLTNDVYRATRVRPDNITKKIESTLGCMTNAVTEEVLYDKVFDATHDPTRDSTFYATTDALELYDKLICV